MREKNNMSIAYHSKADSVNKNKCLSKYSVITAFSSLVTIAQNWSNVLTNCNHDEQTKIWNSIVWRLKIRRRIKFLSGPFRVTSETALPNFALEGFIGSAVWLVTLKGLDENLIFLQICNLSTIQLCILLCSSYSQFATVLILLWTPVSLKNSLLSKNIYVTI